MNYHTSRSSNLAALSAIVLNVSTLTGSTIQTTATATTSSIVFSSMSGSTLTTSTITSNRLTLSTLTVSSINNGTPGVAAYSTFNASSINTSSITTSSITVAPGYNSNISNVIYTSLADSGQTAASFTTSGMPGTAPAGSVISGSYRLTAGASSGAALMRLSTFTYVAGTTYNFTFTGMQGSQELALYVNQYNAAGTASIQISANVYNITTSAATVSGSFTANLYPATYTGSIVFYFQAAAVNQYVNFTAFSMTTGAMNVGIGTSNPNALLCIGDGVNQSGNIPGVSMSSDATYNRTYSVGQGTAGTNNIHMKWVYNATPASGYGAINCYGGNNPIIIQQSGGNVGIGVSPAALLDVNGSIISRGQLPAIAFLGDVDGAKWTQKLGGFNLSFGSDSGSFTGFESGALYGRTYQYGVQMTSTGGMNIKGSVGIGTATPGAPLHIYEATGTAPTGTAGSVRFSHGNIGSQSIVFQSNPNSGSDYGYIQFVDSVIATGYTGFNYFSTVSAEAAALVIGCENDKALASGPDVVVIKAGSIVLDSVISTGTGVTYITSNVGIGATAPNAPLQFANTVANRKIVLWEDGNNDHQYYGFGINSGTLRYQGYNHVFYTATSASASTEQMRIASNGNVLLNASSSFGNGLLQITSIAGGTAQDAISCRAVIDGNFIFASHNTAGTWRGGINGVNSTSITYATSSDRRLKDNIHPIEGSLSIVNQLTPVHFRWKNDDQYDFGFIAQDVYKVLPHLRPNFSSYIKDCSCQKNDLWNGIQCDHCLSMNDEPVDEEGNPKYYSLDYGKFSPYLIGAVKELVKQNAELQAIIDTQAAQIATILARLNSAGIA